MTLFDLSGVFVPSPAAMAASVWHGARAGRGRRQDRRGGARRGQIQGGAGRSSARKAGSFRSMSPTRLRVGRCVAATLDHFGRLDILVNNAGTSVSASRLTPTAHAEWHAGARHQPDRRLFCSQARVSAMRSRGGGKIINIGSMFSIFGAAYAAPYAASKGGLVQMTKRWPWPGPPDHIQVNACCQAGSTPR